MSEPKFTKSEWLFQDGWNAVYTSSGNTVCDLSTSTTNEHMDYNGHLLKVAPKMYEMLEDCEILLTEGTQEHCEVLSGLVKDLLAKARGEL